jgi:hypothetical protein
MGGAAGGAWGMGGWGGGDTVGGSAGGLDSLSGVSDIPSIGQQVCLCVYVSVCLRVRVSMRVSVKRCEGREAKSWEGCEGSQRLHFC